MSNKKKGVCLLVLPEQGDAYGNLNHHYEMLAKEFSLDYNTQAIRISDPSLLIYLYETGKSPENIIIYGWFGYDIKAHGQNIKSIINIADNLKCKQIAYIDDHPYAEFMIPRLSSISEKIHLIINTVDYGTDQENELLKIYGIKNTVSKTPLPKDSEYIFEAKNQRNLDFLIPLSPTEYFNFEDFENEFLKHPTFKKIYDYMNFKLSLSYNRFDLFHEFENAIKEILHAEFSNLDINSKNMSLKYIHRYDYFVRKNRRIGAIKTIFSLPNITVQLPKIPPELANTKFQSNIQEIGLLPYKILLERMHNSRFILNVNPTGPYGIHPRIFDGMYSKCGIVSNINLALEPNKNLFFDLENPDLGKELIDNELYENKINSYQKFLDKFSFSKFKKYIEDLN